MKKMAVILLCVLFLSIPAVAEESGEYGFSLGYGEADPNIDIYRVGLKKEFGVQWLKTDVGYLSGYFELSYNKWEHSTGGDINGVALSPVFVYWFGDKDNLIQPYIEGGIGATYIDEYYIADRNLSSNFQFEDRIGAGVRIGFFDINARYMHYSNASLKQPNHGIDIVILTTSIWF